MVNKIFDINNKTYEIRASGVIFYKFYKKYNIKLLLIKYNGYYEDIGGIIKKTDNDIYNIILREIEDTNNIKNKLKISPYIYTKKSKYILFLIKIEENEEMFNIKKPVNWISFNEINNDNFIKHKLHYRLRNKLLFDKLKSIKYTNINKIRII